MKHKKVDPVVKAERAFEKRIDAYDYVLLALSFLVLGAVIGFYFFKALCTYALPAFGVAVVLAIRPVYDYFK